MHTLKSTKHPRERERERDERGEDDRKKRMAACRRQPPPPQLVLGPTPLSRRQAAATWTSTHLFACSWRNIFRPGTQKVPKWYLGAYRDRGGMEVGVQQSQHPQYYGVWRTVVGQKCPVREIHWAGGGAPGQGGRAVQPQGDVRVPNVRPRDQNNGPWRGERKAWPPSPQFRLVNGIRDSVAFWQWDRHIEELDNVGCAIFHPGWVWSLDTWRLFNLLNVSRTLRNLKLHTRENPYLDRYKRYFARWMPCKMLSPKQLQPKYVQTNNLVATRILCGVELCPDFDGEGAIHIHILLTLPRSQVDTYIHDPLFSAQAYQCNIALWHWPFKPRWYQMMHYDQWSSINYDQWSLWTQI